MILSAASATAGGTILWRHTGAPAFAALAIVMGVVFVATLTAPRVVAPVFRVLDGAVRGLLQAITWLLLGTIFFLVFVPGRLVLFLRRRDPLERRPDARRESYWHEVAPSPRDPAAHFRRQF